MNKLMILIPLVFLLSFVQLFAANDVSKVERLKEKVAEQKERIEEQRSKIDEAQKALDEAKDAVQKEIDKGKEEAKEDPTRHGTNKTLEKLKEEQNEKQEELDEEKKEMEKLNQKLKSLKEDLREAERKLEEKLDKLEGQVERQNPMPHTEEELKKYLKELETWNRPEWRTPMGKKLKERLRRKAKDRLKELNEKDQSAVPRKKTRRKMAFTLGAFGEWMINTIDPDFYTPSDLELIQEQLSSPTIFESLYDELGGEFFVGSFSELAEWQNIKTQPIISYGLSTSLRLTDRFQLAGYYGKSETSVQAGFPITVFTEDGFVEESEGFMESFIERHQARAEFNYLQAKKHVLFYFGACLQYNSEVEASSTAKIGRQIINIPSKSISANFQPGFSAGIQWSPAKLPNLGLQLGGRAIFSGDRVQTGASLGIFGKF